MPGSDEERLPSSATSRSLLDGIRASDDAAWQRLVGLYAPLVLHWCRRYDLQDSDAADVFQEVFRAVATHIQGFRRERANDTFRGWLRTITTNKIHDHFRRLGRDPRGEGGTEANQRLHQFAARVPADDSELAEQQAERQLFHRGLELIRGEFEARTWQAFWRMTIDGQTASCVGQELGMTPGAVRVAKCRVLHRLREQLGDLGEE